MGLSCESVLWVKGRHMSPYLCFSSSLCDDLKGQADKTGFVSAGILQIDFRSHDVRAWVSCHEKAEVRTCFDATLRKVKARRLRNRKGSPSSVFFLSFWLQVALKAAECCSAYFLKNLSNLSAVRSFRFVVESEKKKNKCFHDKCARNASGVFFLSLSLSVTRSVRQRSTTALRERAATVTSQKPTQHPIVPTLPVVRRSAVAVRGLKREKKKKKKC